MKPRLIKFTCPACNARLAVPGAMAGMEDNCPKCEARIKAPEADPAPAPALDTRSEPAVEPAPGHASHGVLDAVLHAPESARKGQHTTLARKSAAEPKEREAIRSTLFDEFLSTTPHPPKDDTPPPAAPDALSEESPGLRTVPLKAAKLARGPELATPSLAAPTQRPAPESAPATAVSPTLLQIVSAVVPKPVTPPPEPAHEVQPFASVSEPSSEDIEPDFGMGEMISGQSGSQLPGVTRHVLPSLGVGLMQVDDTPRNHRLRRRRRATVTGILLFLLFDAMVFCWVFRHRISEWWHEQHPVVVSHPAAPAAPIGGKSDEGFSAPPEKQPATLATTTAGKEFGPPASEPAPTSPTVEPASPASALIPQAPLPAKVADTPALVDMPPTRPGPPLMAVSAGNEPEPGSRDIGEIPGKKDFSAAQMPPPTIPANVIPDPPKDPPMPQASNELRNSLDFSTLISPKPAEASSPTATNSLMAKTEITLPPLPPPLPPGAAIPEAPERQAVPEPVPGAPVTGDVPPAPAKFVESGITTASRPALEALKSFLAAPTWRERLRWVQKPDTAKAAMEKHYQKYPDGPVEVSHIDFIERYRAKNGNPPYCMFEVRGGSLKQSILVLVEEKSKTDLRVDWEAFVEFKDQLLWEFLIKPGSPPGKFRVMIRRKHSFDKDVPDLDRKDAFELSQPGADTSANVYAVKGAAAARALSQQLSWGNSIAVTVQLVWHGEGEHGWVEVKTVPAFGWRG